MSQERRWALALMALGVLSAVALAQNNKEGLESHKVAELVCQEGPMIVTRGLVYAPVPKGTDAELLSLDIYAGPSGHKKRPVVVMVHGGGWRRGDKANHTVAASKSRYFLSKGYVFVSVNYRLLPAATPYEQTSDLAKACAFLKKDIAKYGGDPSKIFLMGHSSGAHLVALLATDPTHLKAEGLAPTDLSGVILLDGAAYNLPESMASGGARAESAIYREAFGTDPAVWARCSPTLAVGKCPTPPFLIFHAGQHRASAYYSQQLADAIVSKGAHARVIALPRQNHQGINKDIGTAQDDVGPKILDFLEKHGG